MVHLTLIRPTTLTKRYFPSTKLTVVRVQGPVLTFSYSDPSGTYLLIHTPKGEVRVDL